MGVSEVIAGVRKVFASDEARKKASEKAGRERLESMLRAISVGAEADPHKVAALLREEGLSPESLDECLDRMIARSKLARQAAEVPTLEAKVDSLSRELQQFDVDHRAAVEAYERNRSALAGELSTDSFALNKARLAREAILATSPIGQAVQSELHGVLCTLGMLRQAMRDRELTAQGCRAELANLGTETADPGMAAARGARQERMQNAEREVSRLTAEIGKLEKQESKLRADQAGIEAAAIKAAIAGELVDSIEKPVVTGSHSITSGM